MLEVRNEIEERLGVDRSERSLPPPSPGEGAGTEAGAYAGRAIEQPPCTVRRRRKSTQSSAARITCP